MAPKKMQIPQKVEIDIDIGLGLDKEEGGYTKLLTSFLDLKFCIKKRYLIVFKQTRYPYACLLDLQNTLSGSVA